MSSFWANYNTAFQQSQARRVNNAQAFEAWRKSNPDATWDMWVDQLNRVTGGRPGSVTSEQILRHQYERAQRERERALNLERAQFAQQQTSLQNSIASMVDNMVLQEDNDLAIRDTIIGQMGDTPEIRDMFHRMYPKGLSPIRERQRMKLVNDYTPSIINRMRVDPSFDIKSVLPNAPSGVIQGIQSQVEATLQAERLKSAATNFESERATLNDLYESGDLEGLRAYKPLLPLGEAANQFELKRTGLIRSLEAKQAEARRTAEQKAEDRDWTLKQREQEAEGYADADLDAERENAKVWVGSGRTDPYQPGRELSPEQMRQLRAYEAGERARLMSANLGKQSDILKSAASSLVNDPDMVFGTRGQSFAEVRAALANRLRLENPNLSLDDFRPDQVEATINEIVAARENKARVGYSAFRDGFVDTRLSELGERAKGIVLGISEAVAKGDALSGDYGPAVAQVLPSLANDFDIVSDSGARMRILGAITEQSLSDAGIEPQDVAGIYNHISTTAGLRKIGETKSRLMRQRDTLPKSNMPADAYINGLEAISSNLVSMMGDMVSQSTRTATATPEAVDQLRKMADSMERELEAYLDNASFARKHRNMWQSEVGGVWDDDRFNRIVSTTMTNAEQQIQRLREAADAKEVAIRKALEARDAEAVRQREADIDARRQDRMDKRGGGAERQDAIPLGGWFRATPDRERIERRGGGGRNQ